MGSEMIDCVLCGLPYPVPLLANHHREEHAEKVCFQSVLSSNLRHLLLSLIHVSLTPFTPTALHCLSCRYIFKTSCRWYFSFRQCLAVKAWIWVKVEHGAIGGTNYENYSPGLVWQMQVSLLLQRIALWIIRICAFILCFILT